MSWDSDFSSHLCLIGTILSAYSVRRDFWNIHVSALVHCLWVNYTYTVINICSYSTYCIPFYEITSVFWYSKKIQWLYFSSVKYIVWHIISQRCKNQRMLVKSRSFNVYRGVFFPFGAAFFPTNKEIFKIDE